MCKKVAMFLISLILTGLCISCGNMKVEEDKLQKEPEDINQYNEAVVISKKDDIFEIILHLNKSEYKAKDKIECYATVEYIGAEDSITVYSGDPLVGFGLKDDRYFDGGYGINQILMPTTFDKGEIQVYQFQKSGGWSADDPNAKFYEDYYFQQDFILPPGEYEIFAVLACSLDSEDVLGTTYSISSTVRFTVKE